MKKHENSILHRHLKTNETAMSGTSHARSECLLSSWRAFAHPNYKHGFYFKQRSILLQIAFDVYRENLRRQQTAEIFEEFTAIMPRQTRADYRRFMAAYRAAVAKLPEVKLTPQLAAQIMRRSE